MYICIYIKFLIEYPDYIPNKNYALGGIVLSTLTGYKFLLMVKDIVVCRAVIVQLPRGKQICQSRFQATAG
jgi:hypothetical protein